MPVDLLPSSISAIGRDFFAMLPRTTTAAAELARRHDDKMTGDKLWSGTVEERPLRYASGFGWL